MLRPIRSGISKFFFISVAFLFFHNSSFSSGVLGNLLVEYAINPLGTDVQNPRFSRKKSAYDGKSWLTKAGILSLQHWKNLFMKRFQNSQDIFKNRNYNHYKP